MFFLRNRENYLIINVHVRKIPHMYIVQEINYENLFIYQST